MIIINSGLYPPDSCLTDNAFLKELKKEDKIVFIPAATTKGQESYFLFFKEKMHSYGFENIEWADLYSKSWKSKMKYAKMIYIAGGNTYKLLKIVQESGFDEYLKKNSEKFIIVGNSAGGIVLGKSILSTNDENIVGLKETKGIGLFDFSVSPHYTPEKKQRLQMLANKEKIRIIGLQETSGIIITKGETLYIGTTETITPEINQTN